MNRQRPYDETERHAQPRGGPQRQDTGRAGHEQLPEGEDEDLEERDEDEDDDDLT
jgi:hypothetical protein